MAYIDICKEVWNEILEGFHDTLPTSTIDLWFKDIKIVSFKNDVVSMTINSPFKHDIIRKKYLARIEKDFSTLLGFDVSVDLDCTAKLNDDDEEQNEEKKEIPIRKEDLVNNWGSTMPAYNFEYTFDNFIVGNSNKFAHAACTAVASNPARNYNPLFIYGPSGLGKTHLLYAITNEVQKKKPNVNIIYIKGEDFTNQFIEALSASMISEFRNKYRSCDMLLIDDIQFIEGKVSTQEEFFHTFNNLYEDHKQIILTSDRPPRDMKTLEDRLKTRFEWGLIADIQPPDLELRVAIIKKKAEQVGITITEEVLTFLAENLRSNIRQIEGAIKKLGAKVFLSGQVITMEIARSCIIELLGGEEPVTITVDKIYTAIYRKYGITKEELESSRRTREIAMARHICIYLIHSITDMSLKSIGKLLNRDHSTIISSCDIIEKKLITDPIMRLDIEQMTEEVTGSK